MSSSVSIRPSRERLPFALCLGIEGNSHDCHAASRSERKSEQLRSCSGSPSHAAGCASSSCLACGLDSSIGLSSSAALRVASKCGIMYTEPAQLADVWTI